MFRSDAKSLNNDLKTVILGVNPENQDRIINKIPSNQKSEFYKIKEQILLSYFDILKEKG